MSKSAYGKTRQFCHQVIASIICGKSCILYGHILGILIGWHLCGFYSSRDLVGSPRKFPVTILYERNESREEYNKPMKAFLKKVNMDVIGTEPTLQFVIVTCFDHKTWTNQLRQLKVLLKSAALMTSTKIQFNVVSPPTPEYNVISKIPSTWPEEYRKRITFGRSRPIYYPDGFEFMRSMTYRTCDTERLFLHTIFSDMDAVAYVDTDTLFMQPPEDLWQEFSNFEARHVCGIAPCLNRYGREFKDFPVYGFSGVNSGVILMNLTRMRNFLNGWTKSITELVTKHRSVFKLSDQDTLTNFFSKDNSAYLYELGCEWNYRPVICQKNMNRCGNAASKGVAILHGCDRAFIQTRDAAIKAVFNAWEKYELGSPIQVLMTLLDEGLNLPSDNGCMKLSNIKDMLLKGLKKHLALRGLLP